MPEKLLLGLDQFHKIANGVILIIIMTFQCLKEKKGGGEKLLHVPVPF